MHEQPYIDLYKAYGQSIKQHAPEQFNLRRDDAFELFQSIGFPTVHDEDYQYSRLMNQLDIDFGLNINRLTVPFNAKELFQCDVAGINAHLSYMVNDQFFLSNNAPNILPQGVVMCSMQEACRTYPDLVARHYGKLSNSKRDGFIALNEMFSQDGFFLYVPKNVKVEQPFQLINVLKSQVSLMANAHNLIIIESGAQAKLLICDHVIDAVDFFANRLTEIFISENAHFDYYALESTHERTNNLSHILIDQQASSRMVTNTIGLNNGCTRNHIDISLNGQNAETYLCGALVSDAQQQTENFTIIRHNEPHCHSNELYKYVLNGASHGIFTGRIIVAEDAQKTAAYQTNRTICLTKEAKVNAKPQLEIYADDVKCGHGATTGQLDENALFYMRARGIDKEEATMLLLMAFVAEVIDLVEVEALRERLQNLVERRLRGEVSYCAGCRDGRR